MYSDGVIKVIEHGIQSEFSNLYENLKDLLQLALFLNTYSPALLPNHDSVQRDLEMVHKLESWLK